MNLHENAKMIAIIALTNKWNAKVANDELKDSVLKIHSIVMGSSKTFHFSFYLPSGRVHDFKICSNKITHNIF
jgi:hypothetical protein